MPVVFWMAPTLPLASFVLIVFGLARFRRFTDVLSVGSVAGALLVSVGTLTATSGGARASVILPWMSVGGRSLPLALRVDPLGALGATLVSLVALVVFVYATRFMATDRYHGRFFAEMCLFVGAMLVLVLAADLITLFIAWEIVGFCSYLLIGFWFDRPGVPEAASKAFLVTRMGDLLMLFGVLALIRTAGSGEIDKILRLAAAPGVAISGLSLSVVGLLLFAGAAGKSAQVPFQGWLPDAMAGPTPVSALLHSATMVAAGVFLVARLYPLFLAAGPALLVVAWVGAVTALLGGAAALVQTDLKRLLAYSTMSQLGLMFVGLGAGSLLAGVLLLIGQALFKATLFLAAGVVDRSVDSRAFGNMGGLGKRLPATAVAFAIGAAALAGLPVTLALPPKDPVLAAAWGSNPGLFIATLVASFLSALYSARAFGLVFLGPASAPAQDARPPGRGLVLPTLVLTGLIVLGLLADAPLIGRPLGRLLGQATPDVSTATALGLLVALVGVALGLAGRWMSPRRIVWPALQPIAPVLNDEFGLISAYRGIADLSMALAAALARFDRAGFDRFAGTMARATLGLVQTADRFDVADVNATVLRLAGDVLAVGQRVRRVQTGEVDHYLLAIAGWSLALVVVAVIALALR